MGVLDRVRRAARPGGSGFADRGHLRLHVGQVLTSLGGSGGLAADPRRLGRASRAGQQGAAEGPAPPDRAGPRVASALSGSLRRPVRPALTRRLTMVAAVETRPADRAASHPARWA